METTLIELTASGVEHIVLVPMFPHFAQATIGAILSNICRVADKLGCTSQLQIVPPFYKHPGYLDSVRVSIEKCIGPSARNVDSVVFSYHAIPEHQCSDTDETQAVCMKSEDCCLQHGEHHDAIRNCYRAQCVETTRLLADALRLPDDKWHVGFQSRGSVRDSIRWTQPHTDELLVDLAKRGHRRVAICVPSYTADCIETLGFIGAECQEAFKQAGGDELIVIPCINSSETWCRNLANMILEPPRPASGSRGYWAM